MTYNTTFLDNATGYIDVIDGVNSMTGGKYAMLLIFLIYLLLFIALKTKYDAEPSMIASAFAVSIASVFLFVAELISVHVLAVPLVLTLISIAYAAWNK